MKLRAIIREIEDRYPLYLREEWDNVGLIVGDREKEIEKIQLSLDATEDTIENAIKNNVDLIITHHPLIFKEISRINSDSVLGRKILKLIKNDIAVYSLHTNLDSAKDGLNDWIVKKVFGIEESDILDKKNGEYGIGRVVTLEESWTGEGIIEVLKDKLSLENISIVNLDLKKNIKKIGIVTGAGGSYWRKGKDSKIDLLITGDIKYHEALDMKENGMSAIDIGHFESEHIFSDIIKELLRDRFDGGVIVFNDGPILIKK